MWNIVVTWRTSGIFLHKVTQSPPLSLSTSLSHHVILKVTLPLLDLPWPLYPPPCFVHKVTGPLSLHRPSFVPNLYPPFHLFFSTLFMSPLSSFCFLHPVYHLSLPLLILPPLSSSPFSLLFLPLFSLPFRPPFSPPFSPSFFFHFFSIFFFSHLHWPWDSVHIWWEEGCGAGGGSEYMGSVHYCCPAWCTGKMGAEMGHLSCRVLAHTTVCKCLRWHHLCTHCSRIHTQSTAHRHECCEYWQSIGSNTWILPEFHLLSGTGMQLQNEFHLQPVGGMEWTRAITMVTGGGHHLDLDWTQTKLTCLGWNQPPLFVLI